MATTTGNKPGPLLRWFLRAPIWLYRLRLGWLLGGRFLMFRHTGRVSGKPRYTVVEVVRHDRATDTFYIASGWGEASDWFRNVTKNPHVTVYNRLRQFTARARRLPTGDAATVLLDYGERHPAALKQLSKMMIGEEIEIAPTGCERLAQSVPLFALEHEVGAEGEGG